MGCVPVVWCLDWVVPLSPQPHQAHMHGDVDVVAVPRVDIHSMEAGTGAIDDLEPLSFLYCQVNQQRTVREVSEGLWRREGIRGTGGEARP